MSRKVQIRMLSSATMSDKGENTNIRFPKIARDYFGFSNNTVAVGKGKYQLTLTVKKAYEADVKRINSLIRQGKLSADDARSVGFVTKSIKSKIDNRRGINIWVSDVPSNITVGADPEFGLIQPSGLLKRGNNVLEHEGQFGSDGPGVEIRPSPNDNHLVVVERIGQILANPPGAAASYEWKGGATYTDTNRTYWFGGHIHLGRPASLNPDVALPIYKKIATVLDSLLALPMVRFDFPEPHKRRNGCTYGYGKAGDIRANYPERDRFEYRVLSGLWLVHPILAKIAIGTAKCIAETVYNRIEEQGSNLDWAEAPASRKGLLKSLKIRDVRGISTIINSADPKNISKERIAEWVTQIKGLDFFSDYSEELNALIALAKHGPGAFNLNLKDNWNEKTPLIDGGSKPLQKALRAVEEK